MQLPLVAAVGVDGGEPPGQPPPASLVAVPSAVGAELQLALGGPGAPSAAKARLWAATAGPAWFAAAAYFFCTAFPDIDPALAPAGAVASIGCLVCAATISASVHLRWRSLYAADALQGAAALAPQQDNLRDLLRAELTPDAAATLVTRAKQNRVGFVALLMTAWGFMSAVGFGLLGHKGAGGALLLSADRAVALVVSLVLAPVLIKGVFGPLLLDVVASVIVVDRVRVVTERVRRSNPATADFDGRLRDIVDAQQLVSAVAAELEQSIVLLVVCTSTLAGMNIFVGLGPQPSDAHWWHTYKLSEICLACGAVMVILSILMLTQPAKVTSACDALGDAINEMTARGSGVPTKEQRDIIEHIYGYVRNLNRGKGMGFMVMRKRISHSFVMTMAARALSSMLFLFPVILSLTQVEQEEDKLLCNSTCCACSPS